MSDNDSATGTEEQMAKKNQKRTSAKRSRPAGKRDLVRRPKGSADVKRTMSGRFKEMDDVGRPQKADKPRKAKKKVRRNLGAFEQAPNAGRWRAAPNSWRADTGRRCRYISAGAKHTEHECVETRSSQRPVEHVRGGVPSTKAYRRMFIVRVHREDARVDGPASRRMAVRACRRQGDPPVRDAPWG